MKMIPETRRVHENCTLILHYVFLYPKDFKLFGIQIIWSLSVPEKGYSRSASFALNLISKLSLLPKTLKLFGFQINWQLSVPDEAFSRTAKCRKYLISTFVLFKVHKICWG